MDVVIEIGTRHRLDEMAVGRRVDAQIIKRLANCRADRCGAGGAALVFAHDDAFPFVEQFVGPHHMHRIAQREAPFSPVIGLSAWKALLAESDSIR